MTNESDNWPLVIDLDGTLIKTNSLDETFLDALRADPLALWRLPIQCMIGRPAAKAFLAEKSPLDVERWPVRQDFLDYVEAQFKAGRKVVLASGADGSDCSPFSVHQRGHFVGRDVQHERQKKGAAIA